MILWTPNFKLRTTLLALLILSSATLSHADPANNNQIAKVREENRATIIDFAKESEARIKSQTEKALTEELFFQNGGWIYSLFRQYGNTDHNSQVEDYLRSIWSQYAYLWFYWEYQKTHSVYAQFSSAYSQREFGSLYEVASHDYEGPSVSEIYYKLNLAPQHNVPVAITIGRQYLHLGRGIAYSDINDGVQSEWEFGRWYIKGFISKTLEHEPNIDFSVPAYDKRSQRFFFGGQVSVSLSPSYSGYVFAMGQKDWSDPRPPSNVQEYHYNSQYAGGGLTADISDKMQFWSELIGETGNGYTDGLRTVVKKTDIRSWAYLAGMTYRWDHILRPVTTASYSYGSGDGDRLRTTNTEGGDLDGVDHNFLYFGHFLAGYALQPNLSNIKVVELGSSCKPLPQLSIFKDVAIGAKQYFYWKDDREGAMSDFWSTAPNGHIGREIDLYVHWKAADQLLLSVRYGIFHPSKGFQDDARDNTTYFSTSCTLSF